MNDTRNLLHETIDALAKNGKTPADVSWVGAVDGGWFDWETFAKLADREYDAGYGGQEVASDMLVVGKGWWMERHEHDGSEWWEFKTGPKKPKKRAAPTNLFAQIWWKTLQELNEGKER